MKNAHMFPIMALVLFCMVPQIMADVLGYDPTNSQQPNAIDSNWTMGTYNPIYGFYGNGTIAGINASSSGASWYYDNAGISTTGYTLDFKALSDSDPTTNSYTLEILIYDSGELMLLCIGTQEGVVIKQEGGGTRASDATFDTTSYHTYRYVRLNNNFSVYVDDVESPLLIGSILDLNNVPGYDRVTFGHGDSYAKGSAALDYILWNNSEAIFANPDNNPIPEPSILMLLAAGGMFQLFHRKR